MSTPKKIEIHVHVHIHGADEEEWYEDQKEIIGFDLDEEYPEVDSDGEPLED